MREFSVTKRLTALEFAVGWVTTQEKKAIERCKWQYILYALLEARCKDQQNSRDGGK